MFDKESIEEIKAKREDAKAERQKAKAAKKEQRQLDKAERKEQKRLEREKLGRVVSSWDSFWLYENGYIKRFMGEDKGTHSVEGITIELDDGAALESRFTATRLLLIGVFALAFKKKKGGEKFLLIFSDDFQWLVEVPRKQVKNATEFLHKVRAKQRELGR